MAVYNYASGREDERQNPGGTSAILDYVEAYQNWTKAQTDHAETSYWGFRHIRAMRAYWLGRIREWRSSRPSIKVGRMRNA